MRGQGVAANLLFVVCALFAGSAAAQPVSFSYQGYVKNLAIRSQSLFTSRPYLLDVNRARGQGFVDVGGRLHGEIWLDSELLLGSFLRTQDYQFSRSFARPTLLDLDWTISENGRHRLRQELFRAFATFYDGPLQITVGRQRVAWGTGFVWTPTDLLNPIDPTAVERDEKAGVDAVHVAVAAGALSRIEAVVAPGRRRDLTSVAVRGSSHLGEYDVSLMGGVFRKDVVIGADFAGYLGGAGFRGEWAYTVPRTGRATLRAVVNTDYNFPGGWYGFVELHHNGPGTRDRRRYDTRALLSGVLFNVAREYGAVMLTKSLTPLVKASVYTLFNINDGSGLAGPSVTWSVFQNLELALSTYVFYGANDAEFGAQDNVYFGALQYFF